MEMKYIFLTINDFLVSYDGDRKECFPNKASYLHILLGIFTRSFESFWLPLFLPWAVTEAWEGHQGRGKQSYWPVLWSISLSYGNL